MTNGWNSAPGAPRASLGRRMARKIVGSFLVGAMTIGVAWAGSGLVPTGANDLLPEAPAADLSQDVTDAPLKAARGGQASAAALAQLDLASGQLLAGAAKVSIEPRPDDYNGTWERDPAACKTLSPSEEAFNQNITHAASTRVKWNENPNCIYMGGYGLGPVNPIVGWDNEFGLWSRSVAMSDGNQAVVLTLLDAVYWEAHYNDFCDGCGFLDLADQLSAETGLAPESFIFASTHSHTTPDFIGGWGGVPDWYMQQVTDSLKASVTQSIASMQPAVLESGEVIARQFNGERRDFYRSAEDDGISWFRLVDADDQPSPEVCTTPAPTEPSPGNNGNGNGNGYGNEGKATPAPAPTPVCEPASPGRAIATVSAYAAHPVTVDEGPGIADADFPAVFAKNVEDRFGGVGMFLQTGLGNVSPRGSKFDMGNGIAALVPEIGGGTQEESPDIRVARHNWVQPVTNVPLGALGVGGFFDRKFNQVPAALSEGKGPENRKCKSASPISVETSVSAAKIGSLWITGAPGESFSNLSNTIEERNTSGVTMALALVNDGLGYIIQSFETDYAGREALGFVGTADTKPLPLGKVGIAEYEDAYSIDHCFGDATLEKTLNLLNGL